MVPVVGIVAVAAATFYAVSFAEIREVSFSIIPLSCFLYISFLILQFVKEKLLIWWICFVGFRNLSENLMKKKMKMTWFLSTLWAPKNVVPAKKLTRNLILKLRALLPPFLDVLNLSCIRYQTIRCASTCLHQPASTSITFVCFFFFGFSNMVVFSWVVHLHCIIMEACVN